VQAVKVSCVIKVVHTEGMKEFLVWSDTQKRKGKRQMERQSYAITSRRYQEVFEKKKLAKHRAEEKKRSKKTKTYGSKRKEGQTSACCDYSRNENYSRKLELILLAPVVIKLSHLNLGEAYVAMVVIVPSMKKCIPKYYKEHLSISEDGVEFLCHMCYKVKPSEGSRPSNEKWK